jgi:hypothetical protein
MSAEVLQMNLFPSPDQGHLPSNSMQAEYIVMNVSPLRLSIVLPTFNEVRNVREWNYAMTQLYTWGQGK